MRTYARTPSQIRTPIRHQHYNTENSSSKDDDERPTITTDDDNAVVVHLPRVPEEAHPLAILRPKQRERRTPPMLLRRQLGSPRSTVGAPTSPAAPVADSGAGQMAVGAGGGGAMSGVGGGGGDDLLDPLSFLSPPPPPQPSSSPSRSPLESRGAAKSLGGGGSIGGGDGSKVGLAMLSGVGDQGHTRVVRRSFSCVRFSSFVLYFTACVISFFSWLEPSIFDIFCFMACGALLQIRGVIWSCTFGKRTPGPLSFLSPPIPPHSPWERLKLHVVFMFQHKALRSFVVGAEQPVFAMH